MNGIAAAFGATGLYYVGFAIFKLAADRIEPLRANRLWRMAWVILTSWVFLVGVALVLGGLALQILALRELSLAIAVPIFMSGVVPLLLIALVFFGERLTGREWLSLLLIGAAMLLLTASIGNAPPISAADVPLWKLAVIAAPALLGPFVIMLTGDAKPDGRHARPITGIAYGLGSGVPIGTAELCIKGWSDAGIAVNSLATPYPYVTLTAAVLGFGVLMLGFQRCRVSVVAVIMTVSAKTHLLVTGTFMYGEPWPQDARYFLMRLAALALAAVALLQFPRHRPVVEPDPSEEPLEEEPSPARDPFGGPGLGRQSLGLTSFTQPSFGPGTAAQPLSAPTPFDGAAPGRSPFDRPPGQPPPGRGGPSGDPSGQVLPGHLAPDRDSGPHAFGQGAFGQGQGGYGTGEHPLPPTPGPYARDPLGRGPYGRGPYGDDDAYEIPEQFGRPYDGSESEGRRPPGGTHRR